MSSSQTFPNLLSSQFTLIGNHCTNGSLCFLSVLLYKHKCITNIKVISYFIILYKSFQKMAPYGLHFTFIFYKEIVNTFIVTSSFFFVFWPLFFILYLFLGRNHFKSFNQSFLNLLAFSFWFNIFERNL